MIIIINLTTLTLCHSLQLLNLNSNVSYFIVCDGEPYLDTMFLSLLIVQNIKRLRDNAKAHVVYEARQGITV